MTDRPEFEKMCDRLLDGPVLPDGFRMAGYKLRNFHVSWGPAAAAMSLEERASTINRVLAFAEIERLMPDLGREVDFYEP